MKSNHKKPYYIGSELNAIDSVLLKLKLKPLHDFTRAPRSIARQEALEGIGVSKLAALLSPSIASS